MPAEVLLAVDAALHAGIALPSDKPGVPWMRTVVFEPGPRPLIFAEFRKFLVDEIEKRGVTALAVEGPLPIEAIRRRDRGEPEAVSRILRGMVGIAEEVAGSKLSGRYFEKSAQDVKQHATGNRYASKPEVMAGVRRFGWQFTDDNQADAGALWALVMAELDPKWAPMTTPLFARAR